MIGYSPKKILAVLTVVGLLVLALAPLASASNIAAPSDFKISKVDFTYGVFISWSYGEKTSISGFELYRSVGNDSNWVLLSTDNPLAGTYQDRDVVPDTTYYYKIRAYLHPWSGMPDIYSDYTTIVSIHTPIGINDPPAPTDLKVVLDGTTAVLTWTDNSENEDYFQIQRSTGGGSWGGEATAPKGNLTGQVSFRYPDLDPGSSNKFRVRAMRYTGHMSPFSNEAEASVSSSTPIPGAPMAPSNLVASAYQKAIELTWTDNSDDEDYFYLSRREANGAWKNLEQLIPDTYSYKDWDIVPGTSYSYKVQAANHSGVSASSNIVTFVAPTGDSSQPKTQSKQLKFYIDSNIYYINNTSATMEVTPVIYHSRTMLPVAYLADPLGAKTTWDPDAGKVTIIFNNKTIELWIGSNTARVNNAVVPIDTNDLAVTPLVLPPGRTMLPLSFIAQNMGCTVNWNAETREVTINYYGQ